MLEGNHLFFCYQKQLFRCFLLHLSMENIFLWIILCVSKNGSINQVGLGLEGTNFSAKNKRRRTSSMQ